MTRREYRLRKRIDTLTAERDAARNGRPKKRGKRGRHCLYCGIPTQTTSKFAACPAHRDLPALDPLYAEELAA